MATAAFTISPTWTKAADGPTNVMIPAIAGFHWAITAGSAPVLQPNVCPRRKRGEELSLQLAAGESLYVCAPGETFATTVTTGA